MTMMAQATKVPTLLPTSGGSAPQGLELRHLRYFVAVADAGTFTHAAARMYIAQPTLSQQIRRLEEIIGTSLLQRRREGLRLTQAGAVLLEDARTILSLLDHGLSRTRHAAGLGRPRLRFVIPHTCQNPSRSRPPRGCGLWPMPSVSSSPGWRQRLARSSCRSASAGPMPAWTGRTRQSQTCQPR